MNNLITTKTMLTVEQEFDTLYAAAIACITTVYIGAKARDDAYYAIVAAAQAAALALG